MIRQTKVDMTTQTEINGLSVTLFFTNGVYHTNRRGEILKASSKQELKEKLIQRYGITEQVAQGIVSKFD